MTSAVGFEATGVSLLDVAAASVLFLLFGPLRCTSLGHASLQAAAAATAGTGYGLGSWSIPVLCVLRSSDTSEWLRLF